jgi:hypothetical protein
VPPITPRKVIIDCDPGIDDAVALALALFDPRVEVLAVTAVAESLAKAKLQAYTAVREIRWQGAWCRKDIADKGLHRERELAATASAEEPA